MTYLADFLLLLQAPNPESHLLFRSERIWAVLGVVLLIWIGIVVQQLILNRKISRLERELDEQESTPDRSNSATAGHSSGHNPA